MTNVLKACGLILVAAPLLLASNPQAEVSPEPATFVLLGTGLAAFGFAAWRRNRKK